MNEQEMLERDIEEYVSYLETEYGIDGITLVANEDEIDVKVFYYNDIEDDVDCSNCEHRNHCKYVEDQYVVQSKETWIDRFVSTENLEDFGTVLILLKEGCGARRVCWEEDKKIKLQVPDANSKMTQPYLYLEVNGARVPWFPSSADMFADDWKICK